MDEQTNSSSYDLTVSGGIASLSLIAELALLSLPALDTPLRIAAFCFAYSLPVMTVAFTGEVKGTKVLEPHFRHAEKILQVVLISAILVFAAGVTALIFHFGKWFGFLFVAAFVLSTFVWAMVYQFRE